MGRVILVSGANRGIGLAIVKELAQNSNDIILLGSRDPNLGEKEASKLSANVKSVKLDLSHKDVLRNCLNEIIKTYKKVDVLINNAGVLNEGSFDKVSFENFDDALRVNTIAPYEMIRFLYPYMLKNKYGRIINMSSGWGSFDDGLSGPFSYSFSKAALNGLTLTIAKDLPQYIKINSMCPGWVRTRMGGMMASRSPEEGADTAVWLANLDENGPSGGFFRDRRLIEW